MLVVKHPPPSYQILIQIQYNNQVFSISVCLLSMVQELITNLKVKSQSQDSSKKKKKNKTYLGVPYTLASLLSDSQLQTNHHTSPLNIILLPPDQSSIHNLAANHPKTEILDILHNFKCVFKPQNDLPQDTHQNKNCSSSNFMFETPPKLENTMKIADFKRVLPIFNLILEAHLASSHRCDPPTSTSSTGGLEMPWYLKEVARNLFLQSTSSIGNPLN